MCFATANVQTLKPYQAERSYSLNAIDPLLDKVETLEVQFDARAEHGSQGQQRGLHRTCQGRAPYDAGTQHRTQLLRRYPTVAVPRRRWSQCATAAWRGASRILRLLAYGGINRGRGVAHGVGRLLQLQDLQDGHLLQGLAQSARLLARTERCLSVEWQACRC